MKTFEFEGKRYKVEDETKRHSCNGCAFENKGSSCEDVIFQVDAIGLDCARGYIYILAEDKPTPADIARRIGEEAATYAEQAIANKIADALENM